MIIHIPDLAVRVPRPPRGLIYIGLTLFAAIALSDHPPSVRAAQTGSIGTVALDRHRASSGTTVTVTVQDPDLRTTTVRTGETSDLGGASYSIPAGGIGQNFTVDLAVAAFADANGDGVLNTSDITIDISAAAVTAIDTAQTSVTVTRTAASASSLPYSLSARELVAASQDVPGTPYVLATGAAGSTQTINLPTVAPVDTDGSGGVTPGDYTLSITAASITSVDVPTGTAVITRNQSISTATSFTVSYQRDVTLTQDSSGTALLLPAANAFDQFIFYVKSPPIADANLDGTVSSADITATGLNNAAISSVDASTGMVTISRTAATDAAASFTLGYETALASSTTVKVQSGSDATGFTLTLAETSPSSASFTATFTTAAATSATNAASPSAATRPSIKVANGGSVVVAYTDASPLTLVSDTVLIDTDKPVITLTGPTDNAYAFPTEARVSATIVESGLGLLVSDIIANVDLNRNGVFGEAGEMVPATPAGATPTATGFTLDLPLPKLGSDGKTPWYLQVTDRAGNFTRTDASASTAGDQNHTLIVDTKLPVVSSATAGQWYDSASDKVLSNQADRVRVVFDESISASSAIAGRFIVDARPASAAVVNTKFPDTVWLTVPLLLGDPHELFVEAGAVSDLGGLPAGQDSVVPADLIDPVLTLELDRSVTNGPVTATVRSNEPLASVPSITVNNRTQGTGSQTDRLEWKFPLDALAFDELIAGAGVKNVEVTGFDRAGNSGTAGVDAAATIYPAGAARFELDVSVSNPIVTPADNSILDIWDPVVRVTYSGEAGEYAGDSHAGVAVTNALLDSSDVTAAFTPDASQVTWEFPTGGLARGWHTVRVWADDMAGNAYPVAFTSFFINADPPPPPAPEPVAEVDAAPDAGVEAEPTPAVSPTVGTEPAPDAAATPEADAAAPTPVAQADEAETAAASPGNSIDGSGDGQGPEAADSGATGEQPEAGTALSIEATGTTVPEIAPAPGPEPAPTPEAEVIPAPEPVPTSEPPAPEPEAAATPAPIPEPTPTSTVAPAPAPAVEDTPVPAVVPEPAAIDNAITNAEVEATAAAITERSLQEDDASAAGPDAPDSADGSDGSQEQPHSSGTCGLPLGNSGPPDLANALYGAGFLGLLMVGKAQRMGKGKGDKSDSG